VRRAKNSCLLYAPRPQSRQGFVKDDGQIGAFSRPIRKDLPKSLSRYFALPCQGSDNDRKIRRGVQDLRRQASAAGIAREGSGLLFGLDPLRLPVSFIAADPAADGGRREIGVTRDGIELKRSVRGVQMRMQLPFSEFQGIAVRVLAPGGCDPMIFLSLEHSDDALSVLLQATEDSDESADAARKWSRVTGRPILIAGEDGRLRNPASVGNRETGAPRRKRRSALRNRRTAIRLRSERAACPIEKNTHSGEREIIARD
jgi:hypothetical protein